MWVILRFLELAMKRRAALRYVVNTSDDSTFRFLEASWRGFTRVPPAPDTIEVLT